MKAGVYRGVGNIKVEEVPDPKIQDPQDAVIKLTYSCICGSDLWWYRGISSRKNGQRTGHEFMGVVEKVGKDVKKTKVGDLVVVPFWNADGVCPECKVGIPTSCRHGGAWGKEGMDGGQGEKVRVPFADFNCFKIPKNKGSDEKLMAAVLTLSDVMCTGFHAAKCAYVEQGKTVAVIGDGAVGLCAVLASKYLKAKKIILISTHEDRAKIGKKFGATNIVNARGKQAVKKVKELTGDLGVDCVLECVGTKSSWEDGLQMLRDGGRFGFVGIPHDVENLSASDIVDRNIGIIGGIAPSAVYIPLLLPDVLSGKLDPSPVFTKTVSLEDIKMGYDAMDRREAIKVLIKL